MTYTVCGFPGVDTRAFTYYILFIFLGSSSSQSPCRGRKYANSYDQRTGIQVLFILLPPWEEEKLFGLGANSARTNLSSQGPMFVRALAANEAKPYVTV